MKLSRFGPAAESLVIPLAAMLVSLVPFGIFIACAGANPFKVFGLMYTGGFGTAFSWQSTLLRASPLMLAALCTALPARIRLVIIGGEGAVVLGGLAAAVTGHAMPESASPLVLLPMMALVGMIVGGLWILIAGALKYFRGVNETISSLLLTYIGIAIFNHLVEGVWRDPASLNKPSTWPLDMDKQLQTFTFSWVIDHIAPSFQPWVAGLSESSVRGSTLQFLLNVFGDMHMGIVIGVLCCIGCWILMEHTTFGFSARITGGNPRAARVAGLPIARIALMVCFIAGAAAGLAGMIEVSAVQGSANATGLIAGYGYAGILVAFMARQNPLGIIPVSILLGGIAASNGLLQRTLNLPDATTMVLQGILFVMILASESFYGRFKIFRRQESAPALPPAGSASTPPMMPEVAHA